jgi:hypothetical protein
MSEPIPSGVTGTTSAVTSLNRLACTVTLTGGIITLSKRVSSLATVKATKLVATGKVLLAMLKRKSANPDGRVSSVAGSTVTPSNGCTVMFTTCVGGTLASSTTSVLEEFGKSDTYR